MTFYEYMNYYLDFKEFLFFFIFSILFLFIYSVSICIKYFVDMYYFEVIEKAFEKKKRGAILTEKEKRIINKYI